MATKNRTLLASALFLLIGTGLLHSQILLGGISEIESAPEPVTVHASRISQPGASTVTIELLLTMDDKVHVYSAESLFFKVATSDLHGVGAPTIGLPQPEVVRTFDGKKSQVFVGGQKIVLTFPVESEQWQLRGTIQYQACDDSKCFLPEKKEFVIDHTTPIGVAQALKSSSEPSMVASPSSWRELIGGFTPVGKTGGFLNEAKFLEFVNNPGATASGAFSGKSLLVVIVLVFLGGLALNLTPCVLPMMPITVAVLGAGAQAGSRKRGLFLGAIYGLAMALTYGILGLVVVLTGTQFGVINSSPAFNIGIAIVFIVLALGMFDIIHIDFTKYRSGMRHDEKKKGKAFTAFFMGIVAALLAGACVAPAVISTVLYSGTLYSNGIKSGLLLPFLLGLGMAFPWPFAGAGLSFLPKPGAWMSWVRNAFGIIILGIALYYGYSAWKIMQEPKFSSSSTTHVSQEATKELEWITNLEDGLAKARTEGKPVFIDFWATWCKNCLAMDATTFKVGSVRQRLSNFVLIKYQAEDPREARTKEILDHFGVVGLPTYTILSPTGDKF